MIKLPKVELHRHLDGSIRFNTIVELALHHNIDLGVRNTVELKKKVTVKEPMESLQQVLDSFWTSQKVLVSYEALKRVTFENIEDCYYDGVKLVELRFAPVFIQKNKTLGFDEIIEGVLAGLKEGMEKYDIQVGLIHIMPRSLDFDLNIKATEDILNYRKKHERLVGVDLADLETEESFAQYEPIITRCRESGFGVTIHSGEDSSAAHVKKTIEVFKAQRIGHGIQIIKDPDIIKFVKDHDVCLEVCPTSNWLTHCVKTLAAHPLRRLYDQGVKVTLNSDDPHIMNINLMNEYEVAVRELGFTTKELVQMNKWALEKSFVDGDVKKNLRKKFSEFR